ncbi:uncharacterized protein LOC132718048 [Ruditapes philippinarum]|uniref:uncharacterized protein LOC132718048 n=1 Tax=Ruditapes philippinarum TaxID=129788 RepID=UPI00295B509C|nr:uncharacterized protein LOC132718048 [Ruditapes philippinarum]
MYPLLALMILTSLASICQSATTTEGTLTRPPAQDDEGGLDDGAVAAIILGCLLLILIVMTVVLCILYQKGYIGNREEQVLPYFPDIYTTPESLRQYTDAAMEQSFKSRKRRYVEKEPIIYIDDDIYHPPKSRPLPTDGKTVKRNPDFVVPSKIPKSRRARRKTSHRRRYSETCHCQRSLPTSLSSHRKMTSPNSLSITSYPDDAVFIPEKGGMKFTMFYETRAPYGDRKALSKTF